uniref:Reverse transcriptase Ty1/copia-type domain-containing protein n=1 Tax=Solanum lycopersicum TaxID=4081 RepID=A0A3Q7EV38_SOLLC
SLESRHEEITFDALYGLLLNEERQFKRDDTLTVIAPMAHYTQSSFSTTRGRGRRRAAEVVGVPPVTSPIHLKIVGLITMHIPILQHPKLYICVQLFVITVKVKVILHVGTTHHLKADLEILGIHFAYQGLEEVTICNGSKIPISHIVPTPTSNQPAPSPSIESLANTKALSYVDPIPGNIHATDHPSLEDISHGVALISPCIVAENPHFSNTSHSADFGNTSVDALINNLKTDFVVIDLRKLSYFLGIQVNLKPKGLHLSQGKYVTSCANGSCGPVSTLSSYSSKLSNIVGCPFNDQTLYRSTVGSLQYLTFTRPGIAYAVNKVSQYMHCSMDSHWVVVKRILCYVRATKIHGLFFFMGNPPYFMVIVIHIGDVMLIIASLQIDSLFLLVLI